MDYQQPDTTSPDSEQVHAQPVQPVSSHSLLDFDWMLHSMEDILKSSVPTNLLHEISSVYQELLDLRIQSLTFLGIWNSFPHGYKKDQLDALKFEGKVVFNHPSIVAWNKGHSFQADFEMLRTYISSIESLNQIDISLLRLRSYAKIDFDDDDSLKSLAVVMKNNPLFDSFSKKLDKFHAFIGVLLFFSRFILLPQYFRKGTPNEAGQHAVAFYTMLDYATKAVDKIKFGPFGGHQFRPRCEAGLVRKTQLDLIELGFECVFRDIKDYLAAIVIDPNEPPDVTAWQEKNSGSGKILKSWWLIDFLADIRSESVEVRIWRHLHSED